MTIEIPAQMYNGLAALAEKGWPCEAVALIGAHRRNDEIATFLPVHNRSSNPRETFFIEPFEWYKAERALNHEGMYVAAIFHSHPTTAGRPSEADLEHSGDFPWMLIAERQGEPGWVIRAWFVGPEGPVEIDVIKREGVAA